jgi:predicted acylesterase/phospholipase RssA
MSNQQNPLIPLETPFGNIAMAFSGGGFRAAAFGLGALSYLDYLQIDDKTATGHISFLSSASGGTITSLLYSASQHRGESFATFYRKTLAGLDGEKILDDVLLTLNDDKSWDMPGQEKQRNLINSFAKAYDRLLFDGETMGVYWNKQHVPAFEVCFNSTEFYRGLSFRFQTDGTANRFQNIGNNYLYFDVNELDTFKKIKLGDVLAASSCFPAGFEPIQFPTDFTHDNLNSKELRDAIYYENYTEEKYKLSFIPPAGTIPDPKQKAYISSFGLMDGGITDNQALKSMMLADEKRRKRKVPDPFDLMIVTDVASYFMDNYEAPVVDQQNKWLNYNIEHYIRLLSPKVRMVGTIFWIALIAAVLTGIAGFYYPSWLGKAALLISGISLTIFIITAILKYTPFTGGLLKKFGNFDFTGWFLSVFPLRNSFSKSIVTKLATYLRNTRLNIIQQMLKSRIASVLTMVLDVNLKQVRRLIFEMFYNDPCWDNRRVPNFIYELSEHNGQARENRINSKNRMGWTPTAADKKLLLGGLDKIAKLAESARLMGTALWFDKQDTADQRLKTIVATGQFTTCVNLLEYVISVQQKKVPLNKPQSDLLQQIRIQLERDFERFKNEPYFLYDQLNA